MRSRRLRCRRGASDRSREEERRRRGKVLPADSSELMDASITHGAPKGGGGGKGKGRSPRRLRLLRPRFAPPRLPPISASSAARGFKMSISTFAASCSLLSNARTEASQKLVKSPSSLSFFAQGMQVPSLKTSKRLDVYIMAVYKVKLVTPEGQEHEFEAPYDAGREDLPAPGRAPRAETPRPAHPSTLARGPACSGPPTGHAAETWSPPALHAGVPAGAWPPSQCTIVGLLFWFVH